MKKIMGENPQLIQEIVNLLSPHMQEDNRRTVLTPLFLGYERLYLNIDWSGANREFTVRLVEQLVNHGEIERGQQALSVVLKALKNDVGLTDQKEIHRLLQQLAPIQDEAIDKPNQVAQPPTKKAVQNISWHYAVWLSLIMIAIILLWFVFQRLSVPILNTDNTLQNQVAEIAPAEASTIATPSTPTYTVKSTLTTEMAEMTLMEASTSTATSPPTSTSTHTATSTPTIEMTATTPPETPTVTPTPTVTMIPFTPTPQAGTTWFNPNDRATYVYVPHGKFLMGSDDKQVDFALDICDTWTCRRSTFAKEQPQTEIYLDSFWIMQTEVTVEQYGKFMEAGGYTNQAYWSEEGWSWRSGVLTLMNKTQPGYWNEPGWSEPQQPIISVSWFEAEAYANWLSSESGLVYKLPTEAQWEKAARGTETLIFPWGNLWNPEKANSESIMDDYEQTAPVGSFPAGASPYGAVDMAGNVLEWTSDRYDMNYYEWIDSRNPVNLQGGDLRTIRGGAWDDDQVSMRTTYRYGFAQDTRFKNVGFRLVMLSPDFGE